MGPSSRLYGQVNSTMRKAFGAALVVLAGACTGASDTDPSEMLESLPLPARMTGVIDRTSEFAGVFCALLEADPEFSGQPCTDYLHSAGPAAMAAAETLRLRSEGTRYVIVPGYGSECFATVATPFARAREVLWNEGVDVDILMVPGRASTTRNAEVIAQGLRAQSEHEATDVVLIGFSKGLADILEAVVAYPDDLSQVVAVVGISGVVNGTPIASDPPVVLRVLDRLPLNRCRRTGPDGDGLQSITYEFRRNWLTMHRLDPRILYFSVAAYAPADEISSGLKATYRKLARIDHRNDGLMIYRDAIIPDSYLLAFARGDHWAVAMPFTESNAMIRALVADRNRFPRTVLLRSIMIAVQRELDARGN